MKKNFLLAAAFALLLCAGQANAAEVLYPAIINGTTWWFSGFQMSGDSGVSAVYNGDLASGSKYHEQDKNGLKGTVYTWPAGADDSFSTKFDDEDTLWDVENIQGPEGIQAMWKLSTEMGDYWLAPTTARAITGVSPSIFSEDTEENSTVDGINFNLMLRSSSAGSAYSTATNATTWYGTMITFADDGNNTVESAGMFKLKFNKKGEADQLVYSMGEKEPVVVNYDDLETYYPKSGSKTKLLIKAGGEEFLTNGTMNITYNLMAGWRKEADGRWTYMTLLRDSQHRIDNKGRYIMGRGTKLVSVGSAANGATAMAASIWSDTMGNMDGNGTAYVQGQSQQAVDFDGGTMVFDKARYVDDINFNMMSLTLNNRDGQEMGKFVGSLSADESVAVGVYTSEKPFHSTQMMLMYPGVATAYKLDAMDDSIVLPPWKQDSYTVSEDVYETIDTDATALQNIQAVHGTFVPMGQTFELIYNIDESETKTPVVIFPVQLKGFALSLVKDVRVLAIKSSGWSYAFKYNDTPSNEVKSGQFWITDEYGAIMPKNGSLDIDKTYRFYMAVKKGDYQVDFQADSHLVGGTYTIGTQTKNTSAGAGGCSIAPTASFAWEWLALFLVPAAALWRRKK